MPVTVKVNGSSNTLVHKGSTGISTATIPDVCKTPSPGGPVPIPYPNIAQSSTLDKGSTTVTADGGNMIAIKGSEFSQSNGDEPGTAGGVKSSVNMKEATWILYSFDVKMDGQNACRLSDKMFHNKENTVNMAGEIQQALGLSDADFKEVCKECTEQAQQNAMAAEEGGNLYAQAQENPAIASGPDATNWVTGNWRGRGGWRPVVFPCRASSLTSSRQAGPAGRSRNWRPAGTRPCITARDNELAAIHGFGTPAFNAAREDKAGWCENEQEAHDAEAQTYENFVAECEG